jgi:ferrous iron transport protein A
LLKRFPPCEFEFHYQFTNYTIQRFNVPTVPSNLQPLTSVALGTTATVAEIKLPPESRPRLMEMGLLVGTPVELVRFAPLGDPVEIRVRGYNLTLRKHEAEQIFVRAEA